jgi:F420-non-reducing hydrogenase iron-sulfur subunit
MNGTHPTIHLFYCSNSMTESEAGDLQARCHGDGLKMLSLPCSGKMTISYLLKAFETGADGVVICSCLPTECQHLEGNLRASRRAEAVDEFMDEVGLGKGRVLMVAKEPNDITKVVDGIERLRTELGATPAPAGVKPAQAMLTGIRSGAGTRDRRENAA